MTKLSGRRDVYGGVTVGYDSVYVIKIESEKPISTTIIGIIRAADGFECLSVCTAKVSIHRLSFYRVSCTDRVLNRGAGLGQTNDYARQETH
jgi:hypothetical protein